jgi:hypothetical protein
MKVNFNNLRKQAIYAYDRLAEQLNAATIKKDDYSEWVDDYGHITKGTIIIEAEDIQRNMDDLRMLIGSIAMVYQEGDEEVKDVYSEVFPEDSDTRMVCFNDEEEAEQYSITIQPD